MINRAIEILTKIEMGHQSGEEIVDLLVELVTKSDFCDCDRQVVDWLVITYFND